MTVLSAVYSRNSSPTGQLIDGRALSARHEVAWFRDGLVQSLAECGTEEALVGLQRIASEQPQATWLGRYVAQAKRAARVVSWKPPTLDVVASMAGDRTRRFVKNAHELADVLVESLARLEAKLQGITPAVADLWNIWPARRGQEGRYEPKSENALSDYVKRHLTSDLKDRGIIVNREVEIRNWELGLGGECTDIYVDAIIPEPTSSTVDKVTVIIETKGCWHRELTLALPDQLVGRYLRTTGGQTGIYLVGWFNCDAWYEQDYRQRIAKRLNLDRIKTILARQIEAERELGNDIRVIILDTGLH